MNYLRGNQTLENCYFRNIRLSLRTDQQLKQLRIFSIFSEKLSLVVISWWVDSQTSSTLTFVFCHLKSFSECNFSLLPAQEPIQRASVFLLLSLRPETFSKLSKTLRASERDFSEPSRIKVKGVWGAMAE